MGGGTSSPEREGAPGRTLRGHRPGGITDSAELKNSARYMAADFFCRIQSRFCWAESVGGPTRIYFGDSKLKGQKHVTGQTAFTATEAAVLSRLENRNMFAVDLCSTRWRRILFNDHGRRPRRFAADFRRWNSRRHCLITGFTTGTDGTSTAPRSMAAKDGTAIPELARWFDHTDWRNGQHHDQPGRRRRDFVGNQFEYW